MARLLHGVLAGVALIGASVATVPAEAHGRDRDRVSIGFSIGLNSGGYYGYHAPRYPAYGYGYLPAPVVVYAPPPRYYAPRPYYRAPHYYHDYRYYAPRSGSRVEFYYGTNR